MRSRRGFVLADAITICALGVSSVMTVGLLPALRNARTEGTRTSCGATLRGFGQALAIYEADNNGFPYMGSTLAVDKTVSNPEGADNEKDLFKKNLDCNMQTYWLLVNNGCVSDGQFRCPADKDNIPPDRSKAKFGFTSWNNSSYAAQPTTSAFKGQRSANRAGGVVIMADRPVRGRLDAGSANHGVGLNYLNMDSSVQYEDEKNNLGVKGDPIFVMNQDRGEDDSYLLWAQANQPLPAGQEAKNNE